MSSRKIISFTDSRGNPLFSLPDSSFLRLEYGNGDCVCVFCRYHSEEQVEMDGKCRSICSEKAIEYTFFNARKKI